ncbi:glycine betaine ABC transporter substrate-binding protein, partial [Staphylococcus epidermidis]|uniref:glycine betaine ABC transporter substrate-binding protein n=1 Tax=Staphylococcus epidermidis TaxID=1282 RepID=UPI0037D9A9E1
MRPIQIPLLYDPLTSPKLHLPVPYSTHPPISPYHLKLFQHHPPFFPPYHPTPLPSHQFLKHNPHLKPILKKLQPNISTQQ